MPTLTARSRFAPYAARPPVTGRTSPPLRVNAQFMAPWADPRGQALLPLRAAVGPALPRREAAAPGGGGLARAGQPYRLPRPGRARRDADRADRRADARDRGAHLSELGLGLQSNKQAE